MRIERVARSYGSVQPVQNLCLPFIHRSAYAARSAIPKPVRSRRTRQRMEVQAVAHEDRIEKVVSQRDGDSAPSAPRG
jgi:hypothetical protein